MLSSFGFALQILLTIVHAFIVKEEFASWFTEVLHRPWRQDPLCPDGSCKPGNERAVELTLQTKNGRGKRYHFFHLLSTRANWSNIPEYAS
jgi:hypothetical protein